MAGSRRKGILDRTGGLTALLPVVLSSFLLSTSFAALQAQVEEVGEGLVSILIETELGDIEAVLDSAMAPVTVSNFLRYVDAGLFDGARFFRSVRMDNQPDDSLKIEVIQMALSRENSDKEFPAIPLERTSKTGIHHQDGTLSMARAGPDTGTSSFSIVINEQPEMDFGGMRNPDGQGFAAFGRVTLGMDVVRMIQARPVTVQRLDEPVRIYRIIRR
jgi:peptidyl-prolyl cis-trans isomerase A (cyclophilin A)